MFAEVGSLCTVMHSDVREVARHMRYDSARDRRACAHVYAVQGQLYSTGQPRVMHTSTHDMIQCCACLIEMFAQCTDTTYTIWSAGGAGSPIGHWLYNCLRARQLNRVCTAVRARDLT